MYLRHLRVQNVKLLRDVQIDFTRPDGQPRMWTVFVGENRLCKTTLLQTIAAAAAGREWAVHLTTNVVESWRDLRRRPTRAPIEIDARFEVTKKGIQGLDARYLENGELECNLQLAPASALFSGGSRLLKPSKLADEKQWAPDLLSWVRGNHLGNWLVAGYGTRRDLEHTRGDTPRLAIDRMRPLFGEEIIGTGFVERIHEGSRARFLDTLREVFVDGGLLPNVTNLELRAKSDAVSSRELSELQVFEMDVKDDEGKLLVIPASWLAQGYQSVVGWVADLVGQILLDGGSAPAPAEMEGCVLIDEIDLHLHPTWQVRLIPALKKVFPRLQFIATTHSPMMLPALAADEVYLLTQDAQGSVVATPAAHSPALLTGSELYQDFFGISKLYPNDLGDKTQRYGWLANDPTRSDADDQEMHRLRAELAMAGITFEWDPVARGASE
jgi:AAA domain, putative AbiEii toxin, Type IV TA system